MSSVELSAGTIEYDDSGGDGPVVVLLGGLVMSGTVWRKVVPELSGGHRVVAPTVPFGAHRIPMRPDADLTLDGIVRLVGEFLEVLDLRGVTLVGADWGGAQLVALEDRAGRVARLVLVSCEAFDNYPPGLPGKTAALAAKLPGGINAAMQPLRLRPLRRLPIAFGWMSKRPIPAPIVDDWLAPLLASAAIRRDLAKYAGSAPRGAFVRAAERLRSFDRPALVVWAADDRVMPPEHGRRLAELLPQGRLVEVADSYTLVMEDQPLALAQALTEFVAST